MSRFPEWLDPFKNEWRSLKGLQKIMRLSSGSLSVLIEQNRERLRCVRRASQNHLPPTRLYLVKQIWALSIAHSFDVIPAPTEEEIETSERIIELESEVENLQRALTIAVSGRRQTNSLSMPEATARDLINLMIHMTPPKPIAGVYFLFDDSDRLIYVGQSGNVLSRMSGHSDRHFRDVRMISISNDAQRLKVEKLLIQLLKPIENVRHAKSA